MRVSQLYCPTLKEAPREAEVISHQLMLRAGMIRKSAAGIYSYLPLGYKILRKCEAIIREEMNVVGAQEVHLPMVTASSLWQETERWDKYGKELLRFTDRHNNEFCLGPTHEEVITDLVRNELRSYKQLPVNLYQIQTKFRDETRPRFGLMRGREFLMKDSYSFDADEESLAETYITMIEAYKRIFKRFGVEFRVVEADSGSIGGSSSAEFMVLADVGEDLVIECPDCMYAANTEIFGDLKPESLCPSCNGANLSETRGIEVGHVFKLGQEYSKKMKATFVDKDGRPKPFMMGCYGIGVSRVVAAVIEQSHDHKGIKWPFSLAPFEVVVMISKTKDEVLYEAGERLYKDLQASGADVLLDDSSDSIGFKFKDADLIGIPIQVVVGRQFLESQEVEIIQRLTGEKTVMSYKDVISYVQTLVK